MDSFLITARFSLRVAGLILLVVRGVQEKPLQPVIYTLEASFALILVGVAFGNEPPVFFAIVGIGGAVAGLVALVVAAAGKQPLLFPGLILGASVLLVLLGFALDAGWHLFPGTAGLVGAAISLVVLVVQAPSGSRCWPWPSVSFCLWPGTCLNPSRLPGRQVARAKRFGLKHLTLAMMTSSPAPTRASSFAK